MPALWKEVSPSELRRMYIDEHMSMAEIARQLDVTPPTISKALNGVTTLDERKQETSRARKAAVRIATATKKSIIIEERNNKASTPVVDRPAKVQITMPILDERHTMEFQGKMCVFVLDCKQKTVEFSDRNGGMIVGNVDHGGLHMLIRELQQIEDFLSNR